MKKNSTVFLPSMPRSSMDNFGNLVLTLAVAIASAWFLSCEEEGSSGLAPYSAERPLSFMKVTQNFVPDIQWLGGRVKAVGVNRGTHAALDSTLVWLMTAPDNTISSYVTFGDSTDEAAILGFGGISLDSLASDSTYTFWIAEKMAYDAGLDTTDTVQVNTFSFVDTVVTMKLLVRGRVGGQGAPSNPLARISIRREETVFGNKYVLSWEPDTARFRRVAIREGTFGAFTDLLWHILTPDSLGDNIVPPVIIGEVPEGTQEVVPWDEEQFPGFNNGVVYFVWMANSNWNESFAPPYVGYATYLSFAN